MNHFENDRLSAVEAKSAAQQIAFAPFVFQAARALRDFGILAAIEAAGEDGLDVDGIQARVGHSRYAVRVLAEAGLGAGLLCLRDARFVLAKVGWFILHDPMTRVNMDFTQDINYRGLFHLQESLVSGKPVGLKELDAGSATIYEALAGLPEPLRQSWLRFDHFYSDNAFQRVLPIIFREPVRRLMDVGANTGKWALACAAYAPEVRITLCDLPGQLARAHESIVAHGLDDRVESFPIDILRPETVLPGGHDVIWMSQFLDCFSDEEIVSILRKAAAAMAPDTRLFIMETFWDRQRYESAAFCLQQTSLYFTCIANGNSQMYHSDVLLRCIDAAGLKLIEQIDDIGLGHTLMQVARRA